mmetsp:Transcript_129837/g.375895  ORF Transcript_129837/g.375895 Transcript_129837/m.375895 type:complete len:211 (+) Transcript_129837:532-1164(+)
MAIKYVPGSISSCNSRPVSFANSLKASFTGCPICCKSVVGSPSFLPTLYPPPKLSASTVSQILQNDKDFEATCCQISGSLPDPMWVWILSTVKPYFSTILGIVPSVTSSCQIPNEEEGPPTFVLLKAVVDAENPPDPTPGFTRMPTFCPVPSKAFPNRSNCEAEQAFTLTPILTSSAKSSGSSWVLKLIFSAGIPAAMARRHSNPEEASM